MRFWVTLRNVRQYDQFGHAAFENGGGAGGGMNMDDIFSQFGDIFGSAFGGGFGGFGGFGSEVEHVVLKERIFEFNSN